MKKQLGIAAVGLAGLAAGAGAGLVLTGGGGAAAQTTPTTESPTTESPTTESPTTDSPTTEAPSSEEKTDKRSWLADALAPLVADGTITQEQADKVIAAIEAARPARGGGDHHGGFGRGGPGRGAFGLDAAAEALGMSADELKTALRDGKSIADVAEEKGVELSKVTDAMVAAFTERVQQEVTDGRRTQTEADAAIAAAEERIGELVQRSFPPRPDPGDQEATTTTTA